jgi:trans-aconitate methyltransferase
MPPKSKAAKSDGLLYRSVWIYELVILLLYGRHSLTRQQAVAELVPDGATVLEVCAGPGFLFRRQLKHRGVTYIGLDMSRRFVDAARRAGADARVWDVRDDRALPRADYVVMQASLYQFIPDAKQVLDRMLAAAQRAVIIAEPVRNLRHSRFGAARALAHGLTRTRDSSHPERFTESAFDELLAPYGDRVERVFLAPGGREKIALISAG